MDIQYTDNNNIKNNNNVIYHRYRQIVNKAGIFVDASERHRPSPRNIDAIM